MTGLDAKGLVAVALWAEIKTALETDFPDMVVPTYAPPEVEKLTLKIADSICDLLNQID